MRFWDSSAIVPLVVAEASSKWFVGLRDLDPEMLVWWATPVECAAAFARREREGDSPEVLERARRQLAVLAGAWHEVLPVEEVRRNATRVLGRYPLRTGDALQLGAAMAARGDDAGSSMEFVCADERLSAAARGEGFVIPERGVARERAPVRYAAGRAGSAKGKRRRQLPRI